MNNKVTPCFSTKHLLDRIVVVIVITLLSPLIIITATLVSLNISAYPIFTQSRIGLNDRIFKIYKFKTMTDEKDKDGNLLPDELRLTPLGKFLRSWSLDELPQLFNVLKGDLSLVGPRPLYPEYLPLYSAEQKRRHNVKPGITGWAQVNGRNAISWEEKFKLDVWYVDNQSLRLDLKILALTVWQVFKRYGINQPNHATMEKFKG